MDSYFRIALIVELPVTDLATAWNRVTETVADSQGTLLSSKVLGYNSRNQLTDITDSIDAANNATFGYDEIGNQVTKVKDGITTTYVYDARNHLREVTTGGSTVGQFLYDYRGLRTEKQGDRGTERYSYDDQSVLFQSDASNAPTAKYEYGPNRLLSLKQTGLASEFYLFDALRSPVTLVRKDGSISARYAYNAWGEKRHESGDSFNRFGFTGHEHDTETGLIYAKARYYDPDTARFLSQDPFAGIPHMPPSLHKYLYAYQNPTVFVDPDGRQSRKACQKADGTITYQCGEADASLDDSKIKIDSNVTPRSTAPTQSEAEIAACAKAKGSRAGCTYDYLDKPVETSGYEQTLVVESSSSTSVDDSDIASDLEDRRLRSEAVLSRAHAFSAFGTAMLEPDPATYAALTGAGFVIVHAGKGLVKTYRSHKAARAAGHKVDPGNGSYWSEAEDWATKHKAPNNTSGLEIKWGGGIQDQGMPREDYLAAQLPAGSRLPEKFKTFDFFDDVTGTAISAKTLNTQTASRLSDPRRVFNSLKGNIDAASGFDSYTLKDVTVSRHMIDIRQLQVAVPESTTVAQWQQIQRAIEYGASKGVDVVITRTR